MTAPWPEAARRLARNVSRRERQGEALRPLGAALLFGGVGTLGLKLLGLAGTAALLPVVLLPLLALARGLFARRGSHPVAPADAAWALDRIAGADGRGLAAATIQGPAGAEAAWGPGRVDPPAVRLLPPRGLALTVGAALVAAVAVVVPPRARAPAPPPRAAGPAPEAGAGAGALAEEERVAAGEQRRALQAQEVREALGLTARAAEDPRRVAERLKDPALADAARKAAAEAPDLQALLEKGPDDAAALAQALTEGADAARTAEAARRRAVALRARGEVAPVPPERRALLERYVTLRAAAPPGEDR